MIDKLRRFQRCFRRWRLVLLVVYGLCFIGLSIGCFVLSTQLNYLTSDNNITVAAKSLSIATKSLIVAYTFPVIFACLVCSAFGFGYTISIWRGEPRTELLLRLIDEVQKRES